MDKKIAPTWEAGPVSVLAAERLGYASYCTIPDSRCQFRFSTDLAGLLGQAESRMRTDFRRYGRHFLIWLSLMYMKNGWPWSEAQR